MIEPPDLDGGRILACLRESYGLRAAEITFLPLGADFHTAIYRVVIDDGSPYFVKLRSGLFDPVSASLPRFLKDHGVEPIIAPLASMGGALWAELDLYAVIVYPFVQGNNAYRVVLSDQHWREFGSALKAIHTVQLPPELLQQIPRIAYTPRWRDCVRQFVAHAEQAVPAEPVAAELVAFLKARRDATFDLVGRAERLARVLRTQSPKFVLCHSDVHAGNIFIGDDGALHIVDWDNPILAPRERDLMFVGGAQGFMGRTAQEEATLFYQGYGETQVDPAALAYFRYERIIEDIALYCEQLLLSDAGGDDREQSLRYLMSSFDPGGTIEVACQADTTGA